MHSQFFVNFLHVHSLLLPTVLHPRLPSGLIHEDLQHRFGGGRKECGGLYGAITPEHEEESEGLSQSREAAKVFAPFLSSSAFLQVNSSSP